jgi:hypothetical protein
MEPALVRAIGELRSFTIADLQDRYREAFGEPARSSNKQFLFRRLAWQVQAAAEGGLSERARRRAAAIADDSDIQRREQANSPPVPSRRERSSFPSSRPRRDARLPPPGTLLARRFQGKEVLVKVLDDGFEYQSQQYSSLSAIARQVTGTRWNGFAFFGLTEGHDG